MDSRDWNSLDSFTKGYIECALWAGHDYRIEEPDGTFRWPATHDEGPDNPRPLDKNFDQFDITPATLEEIRRECADFQEANALLLAQASEEIPRRDSSHHGHDFFLTRNRHGAGFWDRGYSDPIGSSLTKAAQAYGSWELAPELRTDSDGDPEWVLVGGSC